MNRGKIKTFALLLLLAVNVAFLSILLLDWAEEARARSETRAQVAQLLSEMGVELSPSDIPDSREQPMYRGQRDPSQESILVSAILGPAERTDEGGGIYSYTGANGEARFQTGAFSMVTRGEEFAVDQGLTQTGKELLGKLGVECRLTEQQGDEMAGRLVYTLVVDEYPVFGGQIELTFLDGYVNSISGTPPVENLQRYASAEQIDVTTALIYLGSFLRESQADVTRIEGIEMGYSLSHNFSAGYTELQPVWMVTTDNGIFSVNRYTGTVERGGAGA